MPQVSEIQAGVSKRTGRCWVAWRENGVQQVETGIASQHLALTLVRQLKKIAGEQMIADYRLEECDA